MKNTLLFTFAFMISSLSYAQFQIGITGGIASAKTNIDEKTEMLVTGSSSFKVSRVENLYYGFILAGGLAGGKINIQSGFNVVTKGYDVDAEYEDPFMRTTINRGYSIKNFEIPLTLRLVAGRPNVGIDPYILGGGYLGLIRSAHVIDNVKFEEVATNDILLETETLSDHKPYDSTDLAGSNIFWNGMYLSNKYDVGIMYGAGLAFNLGSGNTKLFVEAKSSKSLNSKSVFMDPAGNISDPKVGNKVFYLSTGLLFTINKPKPKRSDD